MLATRPPTRVPTAEVAGLAPAALLPGLALGFALAGAFSAQAWYPAALLVWIALLVVLVSGRGARWGSLQLTGIGSLAALAALSYASIAWAGLAGAALQEANRAATYAAAAAVVVLVADTPLRRRILFYLLAAAPAALAVVDATRLALGSASWLFEDGRLSGPIGYPNALAAFLLVGLWPAVSFAADPEERGLVRAVALGAAAAIVPAVLTTESRAAVLLAPIAALCFFTLTPLRLRAVLAAGVVAAPFGLQWAVLRRPLNVQTPEADTAAGRAILICAAVGLMAGALWALADRRASLPSGLVRALRGILAAALVLGVLAGAVLAVSRDATGFAGRRYDAFRAGQGSDANSGDRLLTSGSNRYDFWRVAIDDLRARPLSGYGAGNWRWRYVIARRSVEEPTNAHGTVWEVAADLGVPGLLAFGIALASILTAALRPVEGADRARRAAVFAALVGGFGHMQVDWLWETFPLGLLLAALAGLALAATRRREPAPQPRRWPGRLAVAVAAATVVLGILPALLASRFIEASYSASPASARTLARRAALFDPLTAQPQLALAAAATRAGDLAAAERAFREAVDREPKGYSGWVQLATVERRRGLSVEARDACATARHLHPQPLRCPL